MDQRGFWILRGLSDERLLSELGKLLTAEARTEARLVAHLAEVDARKLTLFSGMSLFEYCTTTLKLSEHAAYLRITTARAARRFPLIFELLDRREIHLSAVALLSKHLTLENHVEVLNEARGLTKRELLRAMARRWPKAVLASKLRRLPIPLESMAAGPTGSMTQVQEFTHKLELFLSSRQYEKLELARDLTMHANPSGDLSALIERALDLLIAQQERRKFGVAKKRRAASTAESAPPPTNSVRTESPQRPQAEPVRRAPVANDLPVGPTLRKTKREHIPNRVRREVYQRDEHRCTYVSPDGHRCETRKFLEFHHEHAWSRNGPNTAENLRLLCATHNRLLSEIEFGPHDSRR